MSSLLEVDHLELSDIAFRTIGEQMSSKRHGLSSASEESSSKNELWYSQHSDLFSPQPEGPSDSGIWVKSPYSICIEVGRYCNFRCAVCISDSSPDHRDVDDWVGPAIRHINGAFGPIRTVWSGGEPVLLPRIAAYIKLSKSLGNANVLVTNASKFIGDLEVDWVDISVYGDNSTAFRRYTLSSAFEAFKRNLKQYTSAYPRVSASFILGVHGSPALQRMVELVLDAGITRLKFHRLSLAGRNTASPTGDGELEVTNMAAYLTGRPVSASYTRTKSSDQKRKGYWVVKAPGLFTNSDVAVPIDNTLAVIGAVDSYRAVNQSLFK